MMRALAVFLLWLTTTCFADTTDGFYIAGGLMNQQLTARLRSNEIFDGPAIVIDSSASHYNAGGTALAGYRFPLSANALMMAEVGADLGFNNYFNVHGETGPESLDAHWKMSRSWFVAFKPGLRVGDGVVAYLSFSYHEADVEFSRTAIGSQNNTRSGTRTIGGAGIGIGLQGNMSERLFVRGEVENIQFSRATFDFIPAAIASSALVSLHSLKPEATVGRLIIGYKF